MGRQLWKQMDEKQATMIWERFKSQRMGPGRYCKKMGFDHLGFTKTMKAYFADEWDRVVPTKGSRQSFYQFGRQFEYQTRNHLERHGYFVLRSPGSKSPVDLVAIKRGQILFVQCKRAGALSVKEWNALGELANSVGALPLMATGHKSGRGVEFMRILGQKDGHKKSQPWEVWTLDPNPSRDLFSDST